MSETILITGGTGFVGTHLLAHLRRVDPVAQIHLTSHRAHESKDKAVTIHALELNDRVAVAELLDGIKPTQVYHLAAIASVGESFAHPQEVIQNNFNLSLNLLEAVRGMVSPPRILLIGSSDVYASSDQPLSESALVSPGSPYAATKSIQDALGLSYARSFKLPIMIARPFNHIGPGQKAGFVVADFAAAIAEAEQPDQVSELKVGNLTSARDFTDVRDMVQAYQILMNKGEAGQVYNLGSGKAVIIQDLLDQLLALSKTKIKVTPDPAKIRPVDVPRIVSDNSKIMALGWSPTIPLGQTLTDILDYWREISAKP